MSRMLALALSVAAVSASAIPAVPRQNAGAGAGHISFPIVERRTLPGNTLRGGDALAKRSDTVTLYNATNTAYMIELDIGTPAQKVRVQIDTGSDELWVNPDCSTVSDEQERALCKSYGTYYPGNSSTSVDTGDLNGLAYGIGEAIIEYYVDDIAVPGTNNSVLDSVQFGVATASANSSMGIMGVGFGNGYNLNYSNIIDELVEQGVTNSRAFSIALGTTTDTDGSDELYDNIENGVLIFGGIDTKKFSGPLYKFDNLSPIEANDTLWRYYVQLDSVGFTKPGSASESTTYADSALPIVLDTGSTLSYLPVSVLQSWANSLNGTYDTAQELVTFDCSLAEEGGSVDFTFGNLTINIALIDFIWGFNDDGLCLLAASPASDPPALFGDSFLRSVYAVFDQDNKNIYLAKAANCGTNSQTLSAAGNYSYTGECAEVDSSSSTNAGVSRFGAVPTVTAGVLAAVAGLFLM